MTAEQWQSCWAIFQDAQALPEAERRDFVQSRTTDQGVIDEVCTLLEAASPAEDSGETTAPRAGTRIGKYEIGERIGAGGMGEVFAGRDLELGRKVALKFLLPGSFGSRSAARRSIGEARAASALNHPNIVTIYEVIQSECGLAIAMELIEGKSLRELHAGPMAKDLVVDYGRQIALALGAAHHSGIIHRDIKPENLLVRSDGILKVLDFGLAREFSEDGERTANSTASLAMGTLRYMSPEQLLGERVTTASDIFSFGIVLYELAAGVHPFAAAQMWQAAHAITHEEPLAPGGRNPRLGEELSSLIRAMLAKEPAGRPSADEVARILAGEQRAPRIARRGWGWKRRAVVSAASLIVLAGAGAALRQSRIPSRDLALRELTTNVPENPVTAAAISPDGQRFAYADGNGVFVRETEYGIASPLRAPGNIRVQRLVWLPDASGLLACGLDPESHRLEIWALPLNAGEPRLLRENAKGASVSADGRQVAYVSSDGTEIRVAPLDGGESRTIVPARAGNALSILLWSPDGKRLGYARRQGEGSVYQWMELASGAISWSMALPRTESGAMLADGRFLLLRLPAANWGNLQVFEYRLDSRSGRVDGKTRQMARFDRMNEISATGDGRRIMTLVRSEQPDVFVADWDEPGARFAKIWRLTYEKRGDYPHGWTPDSKAVIFESNRGKYYDLYRQAIDQKIAMPYAPSALEKVLAQPTPDGRWVLFMGGSFSEGKAEQFKLYRLPAGGGTPEAVPLPDPLDEFRCSQARGKRCVLRTQQGGQFVFWELDAVKGKGRELLRTEKTEAVRGDWALSSDGSEIAIPNHDSREGHIRILPLNGGAASEVRIPGYAKLGSVNYQADDRGWFVSTAIPGTALLHVDRAGRAHILYESATPVTWGVASPDGRRVAFVGYASEANAALIE